MTIEITALTAPPDRDRMNDLLTPYYHLMFDRISAFGLTPPKLEEPLSDYWAHCRDYLPPNGTTHIAKAPDGRWMGCGTLRDAGDGVGELKRLYVRDEARGTGLGRKLVELRLQDARDMGLRTLLVDTLAPNVEMRGLYEKLGFQEVEPFPQSTTLAQFGALLPIVVFYRLDLPCH